MDTLKNVQYIVNKYFVYAFFPLLSMYPGNITQISRQ